MGHARYPSLYQINTRVWLTELSRRLNRNATLDDLPDSELDRLRDQGFDWVWFLSVWLTGAASRTVSRSNPAWRREFQETLPDLSDDDIAGSGFAVCGYTVPEEFGGDAALERLRVRLHQRGLRLMLDFVPNHTGLDHPWVEDHPEYYVQGTEPEVKLAPANYTAIRRKQGELLLAYGRDPYYPGWPDALQLNYGNPATQQAMCAELLRVAGRCDGVRCDMAMLVLPEVFERTWKIRSAPFWPSAISRVRQRYPRFCFLAEVYWDLEWTLQQQGFDYTYDKRLYDRLREGDARSVRTHLQAGLDYQDHLARFLENHDEPRAAVTFQRDVHKAAAVITYFSPGLRFFQRGQFEGWRTRVSPHLRRGPRESIDEELRQFYDRLLAVLRCGTPRDGAWCLLNGQPAWDGNWTWQDCVAFAWQAPEREPIVIAVNFSPHRSQCYLRLPLADLPGRVWRFRDQLGTALYDRDGADLQQHGLYLDMGPWECSAFAIAPVPEAASARSVDKTIG